MRAKDQLTETIAQASEPVTAPLASPIITMDLIWRPAEYAPEDTALREGIYCLVNIEDGLGGQHIAKRLYDLTEKGWTDSQGFGVHPQTKVTWYAVVPSPLILSDGR